tara:strand:+ start:6813 stop:7331 length:519 start_codon:yes stop_codon:yes gene_type:complete
MTQVRTPAGSAAGAGAGEYLVNSTQIPTDITWDDQVGATNRLKDGVVEYAKDVTTSADFTWEIVAEDNGKISMLKYANGAVAMDGSVGWELSFINKTNSDDVLGYFGIGSGTEAAKGTNNDTAVAAYGAAEILCTDTSRFNKGDIIHVTADRDGTTSVGMFQLVLSYENEGR